MGFKSFFLRIGEVSCFLGVCTKTLRRWDESGYLKPDYRTSGNHRRYSIDSLRTYSNSDGKFEKEKENRPLRGAVYVRVSAPKQRGDLERQIVSIKANCCKNGVKPVKIYYDVASGINDKRKGLKKLLDDAPKRIFDSVWVNYKDRLSRFGSAIIEQYLGSWGVVLQIINSITGDSSPHSELITDLTAILYSFMGRLYRSRRKSKINVKNTKTV